MPDLGKFLGDGSADEQRQDHPVGSSLLPGALPPVPPMPPPPPPVAARVDVELSAKAPAEIVVGDEAVIDLLVAITGAVPALAFRTQTPIVSVVRTEKIVALISIQGDAVTVEDVRIVRIDVPSVAAPASSSAFVVRGVREGNVRIAILFRQGGTELGSIVMPMRAVMGKVRDDRIAAQTVKAAARNQSDDSITLLLVTMRDDGSGYKFTLWSDDF